MVRWDIFHQVINWTMFSERKGTGGLKIPLPLPFYPYFLPLSCLILPLSLLTLSLIPFYPSFYLLSVSFLMVPILLLSQFPSSDSKILPSSLSIPTSFLLFPTPLSQFPPSCFPAPTFFSPHSHPLVSLCPLSSLPVETQPRFQGFSLVNWEGKSLGTRLSCHPLFPSSHLLSPSFCPFPSPPPPLL